MRIRAFGNQIAFNIVDGVIRIALFLLFIWGISRWPDIRRVFQYHGAEHKTVFAFEAGDPLDRPVVQRWSTFHPRCGTSFLMTVMLISIAVYAMVPSGHSGPGFGMRLAAAAADCRGLLRDHPFRRQARFVVVRHHDAPGLWLQRITTRQPDDKQVECAIIAALNEAMELEKQHGGELVIA